MKRSSVLGLTRGWPLAIGVVLVLSACDRRQVSANDGDKIPVNASMPTMVTRSAGYNAPYDQRSGPTEVCYKGITYVFFPNGNGSWGSEMLDRNSKVVPC